MTSKEIIFDPPLTVGSREIATITMRAPTIGDEEDAQRMALMLATSEGQIPVDYTNEICIMSILTGIKYDELRRLPPYAMRDMQGAYLELCQRPTKAGGQPRTDKTPKTSRRKSS